MHSFISTFALALTAVSAAVATSELATFDDIPSGFPPGPYHGLNWTSAIVVPSNGALAPASGNYYTVSSYFPSSETPLQSWSIIAPVTTFDMQEIFAGAAAERQGRNGAPSSWTPIKAQFVFQCDTPDRHAGPVLLDFDPSTAGTDEEGRTLLVGYDVSSVAGCTNAWISLYTSDAGLTNTKVFLDSVSFVTNED